MRPLLLRLWRLPTAYQFAIPTFGIVGILLLRVSAHSAGIEGQPYALFAVVVAVTAFCGGLRPAFFASVVSLVLGTADLLREAPVMPLGLVVVRVATVCVTLAVLTALGNVMRTAGLSYEDTLDDLGREESRLAFVLSSTRDGFIVADGEWRITYSNNAAAALAGCSVREMIGRSVWAVGGGDDADFREALERARHTGVEVAFDLRRSDRVLAVRAVPNRADVLIHVQDVTESRRTDAQRTTLLELEGQARSRAEESARIKDDFLLTISHELRTPLTTILGWLEIIQTDQSADSVDRAREAITRSARAQLKLVAQLLDLANYGSGRLNLENEVFELNEATALSVQRLGVECTTRGHEVKVEPFAGQLLIRGDLDQLIKAIGALLENALLYTPAPGRIRVRTTASGSCAVLEIQDNGIGIDPEFMPHLFDRFRQSERTLTRRYNGLGLGLTIAPRDRGSAWRGDRGRQPWFRSGFDVPGSLATERRHLAWQRRAHGWRTRSVRELERSTRPLGG